MRINENMNLTLTPDEKKILSRLPTSKYNFIIKCVKAVVCQTLAYDMKVWQDGRVVFTPKKYLKCSKE